MGKCLIIKGADFSAVSAEQVTIEDPRVVITVVASPVGGGTTTGTGSYDVGDTVTITATPAEGYIFKQWSDGDTNATRTIVVGNSAETYTAEFAQAVELINTINGAYLNGSGVVTGEGNPSYSSYHTKFYKVNVNSVRITCTKTGTGGQSVAPWVLYSGVDADNRGTGFVQRSNTSIGDTINDVVDTSVNKYIGTCDRYGTSTYTDIIVSENTQ